MPGKNYCPIKNGPCTIDIKESSEVKAFIALPYRDEWKDTRRTVTQILKKHNVSVYIADEDVRAGQYILCKICEEIQKADFGVTEITTLNPNVMIEFGLILGFRKPVFILFNNAVAKMIEAPLPSDVVALERIEYSNQDALADRFDKGVVQYLHSLDLTQKRVSSLMKLAKRTIQDGDYRTTDRLVKIVYDLVRASSTYDENFFDFMKYIFDGSKNNPRYYVQYGIALARICAIVGNIDEACSQTDRVLDFVAIEARNSLSMGDKIDLKYASRLHDAVQNELLLLQPPEIYTRPISVFPYLWHVLLETDKPVKFLETIAEEVLSDLEDSLILSEFWPTAVWGLEYFYMGWLIAVSRYFPKKERAQRAKEIARTAKRIEKTIRATIRANFVSISRSTAIQKQRRAVNSVAF